MEGEKNYSVSQTNTDWEIAQEKASRHARSWETLGDFTTTLRVLPISGLAIVIGAVCAFVALALLRLIGLFTNLFYFGRWSTAMVSPVGNRLGWFSVLVPIAGALIICGVARYVSGRSRGEWN